MDDAQVVLGMDPALGGGTAIVACAATSDCLYVLDAEVRYGLNRNEEQLEMIESFARLYQPSLLILEFDSHQKGLGNDDRLRSAASEHGFVIRPHLTRMQKQDVTFGTAQMNRSFVAREVSIPWADEPSRDRMAPLVSQLRAWRPPVIDSATGRVKKQPKQDLVMALWFVWKWWFQMVQELREHRPPVVAQSRPSWVGRDRRLIA
jgi:hypothetical protein